MRALILCISLIFAGAAFSQDPVISLNIVTKDDDTGKKLGGAKVIVKTGGTVFITKTSASNGKVPTIDLPLGQNYTVLITKEGYVTKVATIDGHYDYPEDLPPFIPFPIQTSLFQKVDGVDFGWLETTPMIKFELDQYGNQVWDQAYTRDMLKKIEKLKEELAKKKEEEAEKKAQFDEYVANGDKAVSKEEYLEAIDNYDKALALFDDADVKKKRDEAQKLLEEQNKAAEAEKKYQDKMAAAKEAFDNSQYESALNLYKEASTLKPSEQEPKDKIAEIQKILQDQKAQEEQFKKFVADGDANVSKEEYDKAIANYESALGIKDDAAVKKKLEDAKKAKEQKEAEAEAAKELEEKYNQLIADADKAFINKSWEDAKSKYQEALNLKPNESHPAARLSEIEDILKKLKEEEEAAKKLEEDYKKFIDEGDAAFNSSNWDQAIAKYEEALKLKANEQYPKDQIAKAKENKDKESAEQELNEQYNKLMAEGKSLKDAQKYEEAINKYKEASGLKPSEQEPKDRIAEIEKLIEDLANQKELEEKYNKLMQEGTTAQNSDKLEDALSKYEEALGVKPGDSEAQKKIDEVKKLIADKKAAEEKEQQFNELVKKGNDAFNSESYQDAKTNYQKALEIKDDAEVKAKIAEIDEILKKQAENAELQEKYEAAIKAGDDAFKAENWQTAIDKYNEALTYKEDAYPKGQITKAQEKLAEAADAEAKEKQFNELVAKGDELSGQEKFEEAISKYEEALNIKSDAGVSKKIADLKEKIKARDAQLEAEEQYKMKIDAADKAFDDKNWNSAKSLYEEALTIKSGEQYPKDQIAEIEKRMAEEAQNEAEQEYQKVIKEADNLRDQEKFQEAISKYEEAKGMKSSDPYPQEQIDKINKLIKERENQEALEQKYKELIAKADKEYLDADYNEALSNYQDALDLKPEESHPKERIDKIKEILAKETETKERDAQYTAAIERADQLYTDGSYKEAKNAYQDALDIKSGEQYPKDQIALCDQKMKEQSEEEVEKEYQKILTAAKKYFDEEDYDKSMDYYKRAKDIRPSDPLPQQKIDEINKILQDMDAQKAINEKYEAAIKKADQLYTDGSYREAKTAYQDALDIKSSEQYPKDQIALCDQKMQEQSEEEVEKEYQKILTAAKKYFDQEDYEKSLGYYERAKDIRPSDPLPQQKIDEINKILEDLEAQKAIDEKYNKAIQKADKLFDEKDYKSAKTAYEDALDIKSSEEYPKNQIALCNDRMQSQSEEEVEKQYQKILQAAQKYFDEKNYEKSLSYYERAKGMKPSDPLPQQRIDEINQILKDLEADKDKRAQFNKLIQQADTHFEKGDWKDALDVYMNALDLFNEEYPRDQVERCREAMKQEEEGNEQYVKLIEKADEYFDKTNYEKAKGLYQRAVRIKPSDQYPKDRLKEIERILNPPKEIIAEGPILYDYGNKGNESEKEIELMLIKAREQAEEYELQQIYQQRDDAREALFEWERENVDNTFEAKEATEKMTNDIIEQEKEADSRREEAVENVNEWREDIIETNTEYSVLQENDVQFQKKRLDAMEQDIADENYENDKPREEYEADVERIKLENQQTIEQDAQYQEDENYRTKDQQTLMVEEIAANNLESDNARRENADWVEEATVALQESEVEKQQNQYDKTQEVVQETENMREDISEDKRNAEIDRQGYEVVVEETTVSYQEREVQNQQDQYDKTQEVVQETENMREDISEDKRNAEIDRQGYEVIVEETTVSYQEREVKNQQDQYDKTQEVVKETETMREDISEDKREAEIDRQGYEVVVEETTVSYQEREVKNQQDQYDKTQEVVQETENMREDISEDKRNAEIDRQGYEVVVEETTVSYQEREVQNQQDQYDKTQEVVEETDKMREDISQDAQEAEEDRQAYQEVVEETKDDLSETTAERQNNQTDIVMDNNNEITTMQEDIQEFNKQANEDAEENADKNLDAIEEHIEHVNDKKEVNDEALYKTEEQVESMKDIDVKRITPEVANELGQKYPEGVTEETFTINDSRGIMKAYVVRRVVVIDGVGTVYEKTQTRYGATTYTRNGQAISEYDWDNETSGISQN